jgi:hypothetical protein
MKFTLKILSFIALLLISKLAQQDKLKLDLVAEAEVIVVSDQQTVKDEVPVIKTIQQNQKTDLPDGFMQVPIRTIKY